jgi:hypothetical protein
MQKSSSPPRKCPLQLLLLFLRATPHHTLGLRTRPATHRELQGCYPTASL